MPEFFVLALELLLVLHRLGIDGSLGREILSFIEEAKIFLVRGEWNGLSFSSAPSFSKNSQIQLECSSKISLTVEKSNGSWIAVSSNEDGKLEIFFWPYRCRKEMKSGDSQTTQMMSLQVSKRKKRVFSECCGKDLLITACGSEIKIWHILSIATYSILYYKDNDIDIIRLAATKNSNYVYALTTKNVLQIYPLVHEDFISLIEIIDSPFRLLTVSNNWLICDDRPYIFINNKQQVKIQPRFCLISLIAASFIDDNYLVLLSQREGLLVLFLLASGGFRLIAKLYSVEIQASSIINLPSLAVGPGFVTFTHQFDSQNKLFLLWSFSFDFEDKKKVIVVKHILSGQERPPLTPQQIPLLFLLLTPLI